MSPSEDLEFRATQDADIPCSNCGHGFTFHIAPLGGARPCDEEFERNIQTPGYAEMDVMSFCGCTDFETSKEN